MLVRFYLFAPIMIMVMMGARYRQFIRPWDVCVRLSLSEYTRSSREVLFGGV